MRPEFSIIGRIRRPKMHNKSLVRRTEAEMYTLAAFVSGKVSGMRRKILLFAARLGRYPNRDTDSEYIAVEVK